MPPAMPLAVATVALVTMASAALADPAPVPAAVPVAPAAAVPAAPATPAGPVELGDGQMDKVTAGGSKRLSTSESS